MKKVLFIALAAVLALSVGLIGCEGEVLPKVLLGATLPETGDFAGFGQQGWGMQKAVDDWNAEYGGVTLSELGETWEVELIIKNNQSNFDLVAPQSIDLVVDDEIHAFLSPNAPADLHVPTSVVASEYSVPQIICGGPFEPWYFGVWNGSAPDYTWFSGFSIDFPQPAPRDVPGYTMADTWLMFMDEVGALNNTNGIVGLFASSDQDGAGWYATFPGILTTAGYTVDDTNGLFDIDTPVYTTIVEGWIAGNVSIIWGNCPGPHFGELITECYTQDFQPEICLAARAALFPSDVEAWGTTPPFGYGVGTEIWWSPYYQVSDGFEGIGNRTATSLAAEFTAQTGNPPLNRSIGTGYMAAQVMLKAIENAGNVDGDDINAALAAINMNTICGPVYFVSETHFSPQPLSFGQWFYEGGEFDLRIVNSELSFIPEEDDPIFPYPDWWA